MFMSATSSADNDDDDNNIIYVFMSATSSADDDDNDDDNINSIVWDYGKCRSRGGPRHDDNINSGPRRHDDDNLEKCLDMSSSYA